MEDNMRRLFMILALCGCTEMTAEERVRFNEAIRGLNEVGDRMLYRPQPKLTYCSWSYGSALCIQ